MIFKTFLVSVLFLCALVSALNGIWLHTTISAICFAACVLWWKPKLIQ